MVLTVLVLISSYACTRGAGEGIETAYRDVERALAGGSPDDCRLAKERYLVLVDKVIQDKARQRDALVTRLGEKRGQNQDSALRATVADLEEEILSLSVQRQKVSAMECKKPESSDGKSGVS